MRPDETFHRLRDWTAGSALAERLGAQILNESGYADLDPIHPLGGPDGGKDALCVKGERKWIMAVYFPYGQERFSQTRQKFQGDLAGVSKNHAEGMAFVTNQKLTEGERNELEALASPAPVEIFHLDRVAGVLDKPAMVSVRKQFLQIDTSEAAVLDAVAEMKATQTGGDSWCRLDFSGLDAATGGVPRCVALIRTGRFPIYDLHIRVANMHTWKDVFTYDLPQALVGSPPIWMHNPAFRVAPNTFFRIFFIARNGSWHQDMVLRFSKARQYWSCATRVVGMKGENLYEFIGSEFAEEFGPENFEVPPHPDV